MFGIRAVRRRRVHRSASDRTGYTVELGSSLGRAYLDARGTIPTLEWRCEHFEWNLIAPIMSTTYRDVPICHRIRYL